MWLRRQVNRFSVFVGTFKYTSTFDCLPICIHPVTPSHQDICTIYFTMYVRDMSSLARALTVS